MNFPDALILLRLSAIGFSVSGVILAYVGFNVVYALGSYPAGMLADRLSAPVVFGAGLVFFAISYAGLGSTSDQAWAAAMVGFYGLFAAATDGVGKAWISGLTTDTTQGSAQGVLQGLSGLAVLTAGVWAGLLWGSDGRVPLLISGIGTAVIAVAVLLSLGRR